MEEGFDGADVLPVALEYEAGDGFGADELGDDFFAEVCEV